MHCGYSSFTIVCELLAIEAVVRLSTATISDRSDKQRYRQAANNKAKIQKQNVRCHVSLRVVHHEATASQLLVIQQRRERRQRHIVLGATTVGSGFCKKYSETSSLYATGSAHVRPHIHRRQRVMYRKMETGSSSAGAIMNDPGKRLYSSNDTQSRTLIMIQKQQTETSVRGQRGAIGATLTQLDANTSLTALTNQSSKARNGSCTATSQTH